MNPKSLAKYSTPLLLALALALALGGCGAPRLAVEPARTVELQGTWRLDRGASDDAQALVAAALPKPKRGAGRPPDGDVHGGDGSGRGGGPGGGGGDRGGARGGGRDDGSGGELGSRLASVRDDGPRWRDPGGMARAFAVPAVLLRIADNPHELVLLQDGRRRAFAPGDDTPYSVTDRYGTRQIRAGWDHEEFVVESRDPAGLEVVERFRRGAAPDTLVAQVTVKARGLDAIRVSSLYRRASGEVTAPLADDGPPAPLR